MGSMGSRIAVALALALASTMAHAAPPSAPPVDAKAYAEHLKAGRALEKQKKWPEALAELAAALAAKPKDGRALSELAQVAFEAGDLAQAKQVNEQVIAAAAGSTPDEARLRAASYYNLGRIAEAQHDKAGAVAAYQRSLADRPGNATVIAHLRALDPAAASAATAASAASLPCPGKMPLATLCACLGKEGADATDDADEKKARLACHAKAHGDLPDAKVLEVNEGEDNLLYYLVVSRAGGWTVVDTVGRDSDHGHVSYSFELLSLGHRTVGPAQLVVVERRLVEDDVAAGENGDQEATTTTRAAFVCAVGGVAEVRCATRVPLFCDDGQRKVEAKWDVSPDGTLTVKHTSGTPGGDCTVDERPQKLW